MWVSTHSSNPHYMKKKYYGASIFRTNGRVASKKRKFWRCGNIAQKLEKLQRCLQKRKEQSRLIESMKSGAEIDEI